MRARLPVCAAALTCALSLTLSLSLSLVLLAATPAQAATLVEGIGQVVRADPLAQLVRDPTAGERRLAQAVYASSNGAPLWVTGDPPHQATARALEAISQGDQGELGAGPFE